VALLCPCREPLNFSANFSNHAPFNKLWDVSCPTPWSCAKRIVSELLLYINYGFKLLGYLGLGKCGCIILKSGFSCVNHQAQGCPCTSAHANTTCPSRKYARLLYIVLHSFDSALHSSGYKWALKLYQLIVYATLLLPGFIQVRSPSAFVCTGLTCML